MAVNDLASRRKKAKDIREYREDRFILYPKHWAAFKCSVPLTWTRVKFREADATSVPNDKIGVYSFIAIPEIAQHPACHYLLYVGMVETSNFRTRFRSYLGEHKKPKPRDHIIMMIERWKKYLWFYYAELPTSTIVKPTEDSLLTAYIPPVNREWPAAIGPLVRMLFS